MWSENRRGIVRREILKNKFIINGLEGWQMAPNYYKSPIGCGHKFVSGEFSSILYYSCRTQYCNNTVWVHLGVDCCGIICNHCTKVWNTRDMKKESIGSKFHQISCCSILHKMLTSGTWGEEWKKFEQIPYDHWKICGHVTVKHSLFNSINHFHFSDIEIHSLGVLLLIYNMNSI